MEQKYGLTRGEWEIADTQTSSVGNLDLKFTKRGGGGVVHESS